MSLNSGNIVCPFYLKSQKNEICCEGVKANSDARIFEKYDDMRNWQKKYCGGDYKDCYYAQELEKKY